MATVFFKLEYTIRELRIQPDDTYVFDYNGPHNINVTLRAPSEQEQVVGHRSEHAFCTSTGQVEANPKNSEEFLRIASNGVLGPDDATPVALEYTGQDGTHIRLPGLSAFPEHFRTFIDGARRELADHARRTVSVLRWRADERGPHNPISTRGMSWSFDRSFWHPAPADHSARVRVLGLLRPRPPVLEDVRRMVSAGESEPLHHDLFREAWEQSDSNPRSALVIGMAAAEIAVKQCISTLVPEAGWLATNLPTPPLVRMLVEFVPSLPARCRIDSQVKAPPTAVIDAIKKGVTIRNQLSHAGSVNPTIDEVQEILRAVHDVLLLLDYYSGYEWALIFVSDATRSQLGAA